MFIKSNGVTDGTILRVIFQSYKNFVIYILFVLIFLYFPILKMIIYNFMRKKLIETLYKNIHSLCSRS